MNNNMRNDNSLRKKMSSSNAEEHESLIQQSNYLVRAYAAVYEEILSMADRHLVRGSNLEIGSAGGFMQQLDPTLITSDIRLTPSLDLRLNGEQLPFKSQSISRIYCKDSLHHIPNIREFLGEVVRCVRPGGGISCVEPYWGPLAQVIYRFAHPEDFVTRTDRWEFDTTSPMDSNQALLYLLTRKHRSIFDEEFPEIEIIEGRPLTGLSYALSGGASRRSFFPQNVLERLLTLENNTNFWRKPFGLAYSTVFRIRE